MSASVKNTARHTALSALLSIEKGAFADEALHQVLSHSSLNARDRSFVTELVYGVTRQRRTLDLFIHHLSSVKRDRPPQLIQLILRLGLYQMRYLSQVPVSAAVNTSVDLAKQHGFGGLSGFVNGVLRTYVRRGDSGLSLSDDPIVRLAMVHSYPDWIVKVWADQLRSSTQPIPSAIASTDKPLSEDGLNEIESLCHWFNQPPSIDLRVNTLQASVEQVRTSLEHVDITTVPLIASPQGLRLQAHQGAIQSLPGYANGWWTVQDGSAQLVSYLLDPQPGETVIDVCAAPGGKTTHIAELMGDRGTVWACDRNSKRLKRVQDNITRLNLHSIKILAQDMRSPHADLPQADRVLVDAPCSGLGTLHRHADARWRQSPDRIAELTVLQRDILQHASQYVKPGGFLVYATCTLHPRENEEVVQAFLDCHPSWRIVPVGPESLFVRFQCPEGWLNVWPHHHDLDGFFIVRMQNLS